MFIWVYRYKFCFVDYYPGVIMAYTVGRPSEIAFDEWGRRPEDSVPTPMKYAERKQPEQ